MSWFMVGTAAVTMVSSMKQGEAAKAADEVNQANASISASNATRNSAVQNTSDNEAIIKANVASTIRTGYRVGLANIQRGLQKRQNVQQGYEITKGGGDALGKATANAAAAGSVGSSVDAVLGDIQMKIGEAQASLSNKDEVDAANFRTQIESIAYEGSSAIIQSKERGVDAYALVSGPKVDIMGNALLAGASSFASSYASSKMKLGLGSSTPSTSLSANWDIPMQEGGGY